MHNALALECVHEVETFQLPAQFRQRQRAVRSRGAAPSAPNLGWRVGLEHEDAARLQTGDDRRWTAT